MVPRRPLEGLRPDRHGRDQERLRLPRSQSVRAARRRHVDPWLGRLQHRHRGDEGRHQDCRGSGDEQQRSHVERAGRSASTSVASAIAPGAFLFLAAARPPRPRERSQDVRAKHPPDRRRGVCGTVLHWRGLIEGRQRGAAVGAHQSLDPQRQQAHLVGQPRQCVRRGGDRDDAAKRRNRRIELAHRAGLTGHAWRGCKRSRLASAAWFGSPVRRHRSHARCSSRINPTAHPSE